MQFERNDLWSRRFPRIDILRIPNEEETVVKNRTLLLPTVAMTALAITLAGCCAGGGGGSTDGDPNAEFEFWSFSGINQDDVVDEYQSSIPRRSGQADRGGQLHRDRARR